MATPTPLNPNPRPDDLHSLRERWWFSEAPDLVAEALSENLPSDDAWLIVQAMRAKDDAEVGRLVRMHVEPYLDAECEREVNQP